MVSANHQCSRKPRRKPEKLSTEMTKPADVDFSALSFDQFVLFFFDHPENAPFWYAEYAQATTTVSDPVVLVDHLTTLFSGFASAVQRYSPAQISHGVWALLGAEFSLMESLWDSSVPMEKRVTCIGGMRNVFADFVATHDEDILQKPFYMWWDIIVTGFWAHQGQFEAPDLLQLDPDSTALLEAMFETLKQILAVPDPRTQGYALHGLGHLQHPGVREVVQRYLDENTNRFTEEHTRWIEQCRNGVVS